VKIVCYLAVLFLLVAFSNEKARGSQRYGIK
jgi:hypothetical protein